VKKFAYLIPAMLPLCARSAHSTTTATSTTTALAGKAWTYPELHAIVERLGYSYNTVEFAESNMLMCVNAAGFCLG
jgi:hypothetical protein